MITELLDRIERRCTESGGRMQPPASDEEIADLVESARRRLGVSLPDGYLALLRRCNGLFRNSVQIYATRTATVVGHGDRFVTGFVEANLAWWEHERNRQWLFFGDADIDRYVLDRREGFYADIDYRSERLIDRFASFDALLEHALWTSLGYPAEQAAQWRVARRAGRGADAEGSLFGFLQGFRPDGEHLEWMIGGAAGAAGVIPRLLEVYRATAGGWDPADAYFLVRRPAPLDAASARELARQHVASMREMAVALGRGKLEAALGEITVIEVAATAAPPVADAGLDLLVYELVTDFVASLTPVPSDLLLLRDAAYGIACDAYLQHHVLWPLYRDGSPVEEPFRAAFELWKHGAAVRFPEPGRAVVFVPAQA